MEETSTTNLPCAYLESVPSIENNSVLDVGAEIELDENGCQVTPGSNHNQSELAEVKPNHLRSKSIFKTVPNSYRSLREKYTVLGNLTFSEIARRRRLREKSMKQKVQCVEGINLNSRLETLFEGSLKSDKKVENSGTDLKTIDPRTLVGKTITLKANNQDIALKFVGKIPFKTNKKWRTFKYFKYRSSAMTAKKIIDTTSNTLSEKQSTYQSLHVHSVDGERTFEKREQKNNLCLGTKDNLLNNSLHEYVDRNKDDTMQVIKQNLLEASKFERSVISKHNTGNVTHKSNMFKNSPYQNAPEASATDMKKLNNNISNIKSSSCLNSTGPKNKPSVTNLSKEALQDFNSFNNKLSILSEVASGQLAIVRPVNRDANKSSINTAKRFIINTKYNICKEDRSNNVQRCGSQNEFATNCFPERQKCDIIQTSGNAILNKELTNNNGLAKKTIPECTLTTTKKSQVGDSHLFAWCTQYTTSIPKSQINNYKSIIRRLNTNKGDKNKTELQVRDQKFTFPHEFKNKKRIMRNSNINQSEGKILKKDEQYKKTSKEKYENTTPLDVALVSMDEENESLPEVSDDDVSIIKEVYVASSDNLTVLNIKNDKCLKLANMENHKQLNKKNKLIQGIVMQTKKKLNTVPEKIHHIPVTNRQDKVLVKRIPVSSRKPISSDILKNHIELNNINSREINVKLTNSQITNVSPIQTSKREPTENKAKSVKIIRSETSDKYKKKCQEKLIKHLELNNTLSEKNMGNGLIDVESRDILQQTMRMCYVLLEKLNLPKDYSQINSCISKAMKEDGAYVESSFDDCKSGPVNVAKTKQLNNKATCNILSVKKDLCVQECITNEHELSSNKRKLLNHNQLQNAESCNGISIKEYAQLQQNSGQIIPFSTTLPPKRIINKNSKLSPSISKTDKVYAGNTNADTKGISENFVQELQINEKSGYEAGNAQESIHSPVKKNHRKRRGKGVIRQNMKQFKLGKTKLALEIKKDKGILEYDKFLHSAVQNIIKESNYNTSNNIQSIGENYKGNFLAMRENSKGSIFGPVIKKPRGRPRKKIHEVKDIEPNNIDKRESTPNFQTVAGNVINTCEITKIKNQTNEDNRNESVLLKEQKIVPRNNSRLNKEELPIIKCNNSIGESDENSLKMNAVFPNIIKKLNDIVSIKTASSGQRDLSHGNTHSLYDSLKSLRIILTKLPQNTNKHGSTESKKLLPDNVDESVLSSLKTELRVFEENNSIVNEIEQQSKITEKEKEKSGTCLSLVKKPRGRPRKNNHCSYLSNINEIKEMKTGKNLLSLNDKSNHNCAQSNIFSSALEESLNEMPTNSRDIEICKRNIIKRKSCINLEYLHSTKCFNRRVTRSSQSLNTSSLDTDHNTHSERSIIQSKKLFNKKTSGAHYNIHSQFSTNHKCRVLGIKKGKVQKKVQFQENQNSSDISQQPSEKEATQTEEQDCERLDSNQQSVRNISTKVPKSARSHTLSQKAFNKLPNQRKGRNVLKKLSTLRTRTFNITNKKAPKKRNFKNKPLFNITKHNLKCQSHTKQERSSNRVLENMYEATDSDILQSPNKYTGKKVYSKISVSSKRTKQGKRVLRQRSKRLSVAKKYVDTSNKETELNYPNNPNVTEVVYFHPFYANPASSNVPQTVPVNLVLIPASIQASAVVGKHSSPWNEIQGNCNISQHQPSLYCSSPCSNRNNILSTSRELHSNSDLEPQDIPCHKIEEGAEMYNHPGAVFLPHENQLPVDFTCNISPQGPLTLITKENSQSLEAPMGLIDSNQEYQESDINTGVDEETKDQSIKLQSSHLEDDEFNLSVQPSQELENLNFDEFYQGRLNNSTIASEVELPLCISRKGFDRRVLNNINSEGSIFDQYNNSEIHVNNTFKRHAKKTQSAIPSPHKLSVSEKKVLKIMNYLQKVQRCNEIKRTSKSLTDKLGPSCSRNVSQSNLTLSDTRVYMNTNLFIPQSNSQNFEGTLNTISNEVSKKRILTHCIYNEESVITQGNLTPQGNEEEECMFPLSVVMDAVNEQNSIY